MPDLITHSAFSYLVRSPFDLRPSAKILPAARTLFYLGTLLPDLLTRPWYILFPFTRDWTLFFHTPIGMGITAGFFTLLLASHLRKTAFLNLTGGAALHFLLDSFQKQVNGNNFWLFPFSYKNFSLGFAWAEDFLRFIPLWILLIILLELWIWKRRKKHRK
jgi:hypothetical protein